MRQYIRHPSEMPIQYSLRNNGSVTGRHREHLNNISSGGLCFHADRKIAPGNRVEIEIEVKPPPFSAEGVVVWCHKENEGYEIGMQFNDADVEYSLRMIEQICYIEQYRNDILHKEGRHLSSEQAATEWISQFAGNFPR